jgi:hypothetical protein
MDKQDKRISLVFGGDIPAAAASSLSRYLAYIKEHLERPCELTGYEDFEWEEYYVMGPGDKKEYEELKKTQPSYTDTFELLSLEDEVDEWSGIQVTVKRLTDNQEFTMPLADLKTTSKKSPNYQLLHDYAVWFVNNR